MFVLEISIAWLPNTKEVAELFVLVRKMFGRHSMILLAVLKLAQDKLDKLGIPKTVSEILEA